jgi:SOS-response transcriptional repressor LexA
MMHYAPSTSKCLLHQRGDYDAYVVGTSDRLRQARERAGYSSASAAAEALGVPVATYVQHENGNRGVPASRAERYARFFRVAPEWILYGKRGKDEPFVELGPRLPVVGPVAAGVWREAWQDAPEDQRSFTGRPDVNAPLEHRYGVRVEGDSMNELYPAGTILECVSAMGGVAIENGRRVIVSRRRNATEFEVTVKEYFRDENGVEWLVPRSRNPAFQTPVRADQQEPGIDEVRVIALVVGSYRPE